MRTAPEGRSTSFQGLLEQGVPRQRASRIAVRVTFGEVLEATYQRTHVCFSKLVSISLLGMVLVMAWVYKELDGLRAIHCDMPLDIMIRLLYCLIVIQVCKQELARCLLCYNPNLEGPPPLRVVFFNALVDGITWLWPIAAGVMTFEASNCEENVIFCTRVLIVTHLVVGFLVVVLPRAIVLVIFILVTRGYIHLPRSSAAAPEDLVDRLDAVTYKPEDFDDSNPQGYSTACPICLENFEEGRPIVRTPCPSSARGHAFHKDCLAGWLNMARNCPLCRTDLVEAHRSGAASAA